ncbi:glycosyltransferase [Paenibacillus sp. MBLB4367]|uniref:glycosyltransferase n=1 Tax=Paenibacillus sp. MBLB4367 TaxID=3384767 RepID=UPI0039080E25
MRIPKKKTAGKLRRTKSSRPRKKRRHKWKASPPPPIVSRTESGESLNTAAIAAQTYDVLRFPVINWSFRRQRPQQIASQFAENGHRVFYFSLDIHAMEQEDTTQEEIARQTTMSEIEPNVWEIKLCANNRLNVYRDSLSDPLDLQYLIWSIEHVIQVFEIRTFLSIVDLPFWAPLAKAICRGFTVYDCMDDHAGFTTNSPGMLAAEAELLASADMVVASSQRLYDYAANKNDKTVLIRNGAEFERFYHPRNRTAPELAAITGPVIGYYGAISDWFDIGLIEYLAARNPRWTFVLIGHTFGCDTSGVKKLKNVFLLGEMPYNELPSYVHGFDVCLIPFLVNNLTLATNPVKVYEYLAAGKPVVATKLPELELLGKQLLYLAEEPEQFENAIRQSLAEDNELEAMKRKRFAAAHTWKDRYLTFHSAVLAHLFPKVSVVIVAFNRWPMTQACIESLLHHSDYPNMEIVIVNNGSTDETAAMLAGLRHPQIKVVASERNNGFSGGYVIGCNAASGDYLVLLNNDTIVPRGWLSRLITPLREHPEIGLVGPMSNHVGNDQALDHFHGDSELGADPAWLDDFYRFYKGSMRYSDMLGFFCVAIRRETYLKVGELDTGFGIGMFEDDDYCKRVRMTGYRLAIVEDAFVYHHGSASFRNMDQEKYMELWMHNKQYFERKWKTEWSLPKPPASIFHNLTEPGPIAEAVRRGGLKSVLIIGETDWSPHPEHWKSVAESLAAGGKQLVIVYVHTYHGKPLIGTRKVGPSFYMTNRIDLFERCSFDLVLHRRDADVPEPFKPHAVALEAIRNGRLRMLDRNQPPSARAVF